MNLTAISEFVALIFTESSKIALFSQILTDLNYNFLTFSPHKYDEILKKEVFCKATVILIDKKSAQLLNDEIGSLKRTLKNAHSPILVILDPEDKSEPWLEAGYDDVLRLPLGKTELSAKLKMLSRLRKCSEESAKQNLFEAFVEQSLVGICIFDKDKFYYVNPALAELIGYPREIILDKFSPLDFIYPEDLPLATRMIEKRLRGEIQKAHYTFRVVRKDRTVVYCEVFGRRIDYCGEPAIITSVIDISERIRAEKALRNAQREWELIFNSIGHPTMILGPDHTILEANIATQRMLGKSADELRGRKCYEIFHLNNKVPSNCPLEKSLKSGSFETSEMKMEALGKIFIVSSTPVIEENGEIKKFIHIATDITKWKQDQVEKQKLQQQILQMQKLEAIGRLASGVAHDFNNLLTGIMGYAQLLSLKLSHQHPLHSYAKEIIKSAEQAAYLTQQLLAFGRKQMVNPTVLNLNSIVAQMEKMLRHTIGENIELITQLEPVVRPIKADPGQIQQIIMNLVINAKDAIESTARKRGKIIIKTENVFIDKSYCQRFSYAYPGHFVVLSVEDSGCGMDEETMKHIFEPFFTTKELGKGTGLGLSVVYGIVKQQGGWINVYSEPQKGTVFKIYFKITSSEESLPEEEVSERPLDIFKGNGEKILIVEDERVVRELARDTLKEYGYEVQEASTFKEALEVFKRHNYDFDLVFTDIVLPDGSGIELIKQLVVLKPNLRVLLSSGYADERTRWQEIQKKHFPFLPKPYVPIELLKIVKEVLGGSRS